MVEGGRFELPNPKERIYSPPRLATSLPLQIILETTVLYLMAVRTGLEPATSCVTGRHSNQLNYRTILVAGTGFEPATFGL
jgi:hypothetical protein